MGSSRRPYQIRQAILEALAEVYPAGHDTERLLRCSPLTNLRVSPGEVVPELGILQAGGFVQDLRPGREAWWKISYSGLCQSRRESVLEELVWGEEAL